MNARSSDDRAERAQGAGPSWPDFLRQAGIWVAFLLVYQAARGAAGGDAAEATRNARVLVRAEQALGTFFEPALQREALETGGALVDAANWTYWLSQFAVVSLALVWIYLFRHPAFVRVRNTIILANVLGLAGYVAHPTAPPRLCRIRTSSTRSRARRR